MGAGIHVSGSLIDQALETWREGERLLDELPPLTPDHETVRLELISLREAYRQLTGRSTASTETLASCADTVATAKATIRIVRAKFSLPPEG
jgi:hypothetical protein